MRSSSHASDTIIDFVSSVEPANIPPLAAERAKAAIADSIAVAYAGAYTDVCTRLIAALGDCGLLSGTFPLLGTKHVSNVGDAVVFNGVAIHALDYDDTIHPGPLHPSCHILPALLAAAEIRPVDGESFLTAFITGCEIEAHLALAMNPEHYGHGWHSTSTIGTLAAAMATAQLIGLDRPGIERCLGIAVSSAAGLRLNIGTMTKPLHAGNAARAALMAAFLARRDFTAAPSALDGELGYLAVFCEPRTFKAEQLLKLGAEYQLTKPGGMGLKPYACCGEATGAVEASLDLARRGIPTGSIDKIRVETNQRATMILAYPQPNDIEQARFSLPFCAVAPLVTGRADLLTFSEPTLRLPELQRLLPLVEHAVNKDHADEREFGAFTELLLRDGTTARAEIDQAKGWSMRFLTEAEQRWKFLDCTSHVRSPASANQLFDMIIGLNSVKDVRTVIRELALP